MIETPPSRPVAQEAPPGASGGSAPPRAGGRTVERTWARTWDCDTCVVGDDVAGLVLALDLARRGRDVLCLAFPPRPDFPLDGTLAPGFALPTTALVERVGKADAQELLILSAEAAERGLAFAHRAEMPVGPRGRLTVARAHAAAQLAAEHALRQDLVPDSTILVEAEDLAALLGTSAFALGLGVVPAERVAPDLLKAALRAAAEAAGARFMAVAGGLAADLRGVRKYLTPDLAAESWRVRAFQVAVCGTEAFERLGPKLAPLVRSPWVGGTFEAPGLEVPYAGLVEEAGLTGLRYHVDAGRLTLAAATATPALTRGGAARVLRRHAGEVYPLAAALVAGARACQLPDTAGMPQVFEGERGVWYALAAPADALTHDILAGRLIAGAIAEKDDRIALLQPFAAPSLRGWAGRLARFAAYWHVRLAAHLHTERLQLERLQLENLEPAPPLASVPPPADAARTVAADTRPRRSVAATSRHAARAALHAASGWASGLAARAAAQPPRRRARQTDGDDEPPPQRR